VVLSTSVSTSSWQRDPDLKLGIYQEAIKTSAHRNASKTGRESTVTSCQFTSSSENHLKKPNSVGKADRAGIVVVSHAGSTQSFPTRTGTALTLDSSEADHVPLTLSENRNIL
jgi:hypothetical protein